MDTIYSHENGEMKKKTTPHALILAHHAHGHLVSAFYLSMALARRGLMVSFVSFEAETLPLISKHKAELRTLESLRFLNLPRPQAPPKSFLLLAGPELMKASFEELKIREKLFGSTKPPTCILATMFMLWAKDLALELQIPRYTIFGSGATVLRYCQALKDLFAQDVLRITKDEKIEKVDGQINVAGIPVMTFADLMPISIEKPSFFKRVAEITIWEAHGVLVNTFNDLEAEAMDAVRKFTTVHGQKFYAVGPFTPMLIPPGVVEVSKHAEEECLRWLSLQPASSVVYVCFGSNFSLNPDQIKAVASGLERSKHRFLWVLPGPDKSQGNDSPDHLPPDFQARVAGFGFVLKGWAPQVEVLSHPSTGGFLTHCGWNSCLEAISRGIPMIGFPVVADQQMNCRFLVNQLRIAVEITRDANGIPTPNAVEGAIRQVMEEEQWRAIKGRGEPLQAAAAAAMAFDGSTMRERDELAEDIKAL